jgi:hypothetical protein
MDMQALGTRGPRTVQIRLDDDLYEWLRTKSFVERRSMNALVLEALARARAGEMPQDLWQDRRLSQ